MPTNEIRAFNRLYCQALKLNVERSRSNPSSGLASLGVIYSRLQELKAALKSLGLGHEMRTNFRASQQVLLHVAKSPDAYNEIMVCPLQAAEERDATPSACLLLIGMQEC